MVVVFHPVSTPNYSYSIAMCVSYADGAVISVARIGGSIHVNLLSSRFHDGTHAKMRGRGMNGLGNGSKSSLGRDLQPSWIRPVWRRMISQGRPWWARARAALGPCRMRQSGHTRRTRRKAACWRLNIGQGWLVLHLPRLPWRTNRTSAITTTVKGP